MDKRLDQIKEGAGLQESRINEELVEFLKRHSDKFTFLILIVAIAIVGQKWLHNYRIGAENRAWAEYAAAGSLGPQNLIEVANRHSGRPGLRLQALLDAADQYLHFVRLGLTEVAAFDVQNRPQVLFEGLHADDDLLSAEQRAEYLGAADDLYARVVELAGADEAKRLYLLGALFGRAAVAEERLDKEAARAFYERAAQQAQTLFPGHAQWAEFRMATLDSLAEVVMPIPEPARPRVPGLDLPDDLSDVELPQSFFEEMFGEHPLAEESEQFLPPQGEDEETEDEDEQVGADGSGS